MIDRYNFNISTNSTVDLLGTYTSSGEVRFETILFCGQHKCLIWWVYVLVFWVFHSPKTRGVVYLCNEKPEFRNILGAWVVRCTHVSDQVSLKSVTCHVSHLPGALMDALLNNNKHQYWKVHTRWCWSFLVAILIGLVVPLGVGALWIAFVDTWFLSSFRLKIVGIALDFKVDCFL